MNVFDLFATLSLDTSEYDKGLDDAEKKGEGFGGKLAKGMGTAAKAIGAGLTVAASGVAVLTTQSVKAYADYEQLVGGVETLFGNSYSSVEEYAEGIGSSIKYASDTWDQYQQRQQTVLDNAKNAYKTAGLSANEYMETVTSFAAALNASLGENAWQSANYAQTAIISMADNANKMGTSIESIQNAYMGFSKQNYTMLDNLKLGYGGTKTEMERLLRDAERLEGYVEGAFDIENFADIVEAIDIIQENLGIAGTTAKEAASTISGSVSMMKSAWTNLVAGLADDEADFDMLIDNMVESVEIAGKNIMPRVEKALNGVAKLIEKLAPIIAEKVPALISEILPGLMSAATDIVNAIVKVLPTILTAIAMAIVDDAPILIQGLIDLVMALVTAMPDIIKGLIDVLPEIIQSIISALVDSIPVIIPMLVSAVLDTILAIVDNIDALVDGFIALMVAVTQGIIDALPVLIEKLPEILVKIGEALIRNVPLLIAALVQCVVKIAAAIWDLLKPAMQRLGEWFSDLLANVGEWLSELPGKIAYWIGYAIGAAAKFLATLPQRLDAFWRNIDAKVKEFFANFKNKAVEGARNFADSLINGIKNLPEKIRQIGHNIIEGLKNGIREKWDELVNWFSNLGQGLIDGFKNTFKIGSPSKVFAEMGGFMAEGLGIGWDDEFARVRKDIENVDLNMEVQANANRTAEMTQQQQPIVIDNHIDLEVDGRKIFKTVQRQNKINTLSTGYNALALL